MRSYHMRLPGVVAGISALLVSICVLAGCGSNMTEQVRAQANDDIAALASLTAQDVARYFSAEDTDALTVAGVDPLGFYSTLFEGVQCTVSGVDVGQDSAVAHLYVTGRDLSGVFDAMRLELNGRLATSDGRDGLKDLDDTSATAQALLAFMRLADETPATFATTKLDLVYVRSGSSWQLVDTSELVQALLGGFDPAVAAQSSPALPYETEVQTDTPFTSVVATVDADGYTRYTQ